MGPDDLGAQVRLLRARAGMSLRELSRKAGMSAAALSAVEHGRSSPTLATLHKVLSALGTGFQDFFAGAQAPSEEPVFRRAGRREARDAHRRYEFLFPQRADVRFELVSETIAATEGRVQWETHDCDMGGLVLSGGPARLEIEGRRVGAAPRGRVLRQGRAEAPRDEPRPHLAEADHGVVPAPILRSR